LICTAPPEKPPATVDTLPTADSAPTAELLLAFCTGMPLLAPIAMALPLPSIVCGTIACATLGDLFSTG